LPSFRVGRRRGSNARCDLRGGLFLGSKLWCWLGRLSDAFLDAFSCASPLETSTLVVSYWMHVEEFILQVVEVVVIEGRSVFSAHYRIPVLGVAGGR